VSTDEQADKGYSQRDQEERLKRFCVFNSIQVRNVIFEDHSAKTFNRPEWKKLILNLKKHKNKIELVLFTKWDRFSRNTGDAYQTISILRKLGVEPQAIEQPLDMSIPESKMMLAIYLAAPEVENDRRALNVFYGMRRARKEGRYMGLAPIGYQNKSYEDGRKYIAPKEPEASIIRWAYEELSKGIFNTEQILLQAREKGFTGAKSLFWVAIRNPVYCGKIFIPQFKDEDSQFVKGQHEPIITEDLYYNVQDMLDGRKREKYAPKIVGDDKLPLRGFLICPKCGKLLTGSTSKGRKKYYTYYHCFGKCNQRFQAEPVNQLLLDELSLYIPKTEVKKLYAMLIAETYYEETKEIQLEKKRVLAQIKDYELRLLNARELIVLKKIDEDDFRELKSGYKEKLERLGVK
jgi:DNA invertase Pin-like site-specific DNA recombinase